MAIDLDAIRARLEQTESLFWENDCQDLEDMCEADLAFIRNAPGDIAALIAELARVNAELIEAKADLTDVEIERNNMQYRLNKLDIDY